MPRLFDVCPDTPLIGLFGTTMPLKWIIPVKGRAVQVAAKTRQLSWCDRCRENSVKIKVYKNKVGALVRVYICLNKGHGLIESEVISYD